MVYLDHPQSSIRRQPGISAGLSALRNCFKIINRHSAFEVALSSMTREFYADFSVMFVRVGLMATAMAIYGDCIQKPISFV